MNRRFGLLALAVVLSGVGSCGDDTGPRAGILTVSLATPLPGADGAILLTVAGPAAPTSVTAAPGLRVFSQALAATNRLAITGPLPSGPILTLGVADMNQAGQYVVTIQDVAATDYSLRPLSGYSLTISK